MSRSIVIVILVIILIAIPILMRKLSWKKMINALNDVDYNRYYDIIDSFSCKMTFSAFDREICVCLGLLHKIEKMMLKIR